MTLKTNIKTKCIFCYERCINVLSNSKLVDLDMESYMYQKARNEAFSRWLSYAANHKVEEETSIKAKQVSASMIYIKYKSESLLDLSLPLRYAHTSPDPFSLK